MRRQLHFTDEGVVDAVVGYRVWEAWPVDGVVHLSSVTRRENEWPCGVPLYAECLCGRPRLDHSRTRPGQDRLRVTTEFDEHTCGVYAWAEPVVPYTPRLSSHPVSGYAYVSGEVLLWGRVHRHERGYRAEVAQPSALYVSGWIAHRQRTLVELTALQWSIPTVLVGEIPRDVFSAKDVA